MDNTLHPSYSVSLSSILNASKLKEELGNPFDVVVRSFNINAKDSAAIVFIDHLVNKDHINDFIIKPLTENNSKKSSENFTENNKDIDNIINNLSQIGNSKFDADYRKAIEAVLCGDTVLFIDSHKTFVIFGTREWATKSISEPKIESVVRGPAEALNETAVISISQIRRRLKDPKLRIKSYKIGRRSKTDVFLFYIEDIVNKDVLNKVQKRVEKIDIDAILDTGYIQEFIQDDKFSPFSQMQYTEKPDSVVGHLLEGKVVILQDGSPNALIAPSLFAQFYNTAEDYYEHYMFAIFLRLIRFTGLFISLFLSALYIAFVCFHPEMLPTELMLSIASSRFTVPFSTVTEILLMEIGVEILREASIRIPNPLGTTIGIVGALVIGNSAVSAGFVSPAVVIIVGLGAISAHASPSYSASFSIRILRFVVIAFSATFGLFGIVLISLLLAAHMLSLKSFGIDYFSPIIPFKFSDWKDVLIRVPWTFMKKRPLSYKPVDKQRIAEGRVEK